MSRLALVLVVLASCSKNDANTEVCRVEAEALGKLLRDTPHEMSVFQPPRRDVTLVKRTDVPVAPIPDGDVVVISPTVVSFRGESVGADTLIDRLRGARKRNPNANRLYMEIDEAAPWEKVVGAVASAIGAGFPVVGFAFATDAKLAPVGPSKIDHKLDTLLNDHTRTDQEVGLAKIVEDVIDGCPALKREFRKADGVAESKADAIIREIPPALIECNCQVDIAAFRSVMWRMVAVAPSVQVIAIDPKAGATLALPRATPWAEASKRLTPTTKAAQLVAE